MLSRFFRRGVIVSMAVTLIMAATAGLAAASSVPGWRVYSRVIVKGSAVHITNITADSPGDAWAFGYREQYKDNDTSVTDAVMALHWNGRSWGAPEYPAAIQAIGGVGTAGASSASNVWGFNDDAGWIHWNGQKWTSGSLPNNPYSVYSSLVFSPDDVWAFGYLRATAVADDPYLAHFNGHSWQQVSSPCDASSLTVNQVSAVSENDFWISCDFDSSLMATYEHWNGSKWNAVPAASDVLVDTMFAPSATSLWIGGTNSTDTDAVAEYWNGKTWKAETPSARQSTSLTDMVSDGHGGVWAIENGPLVRNGPVLDDGSPSTWAFYHYTDGKWSGATDTHTFDGADPGKQDVFMNQVAFVPGTSSLWAAGDNGDQIGLGHTASGVIMLYGDVPH
jgi:hypothetical protein